MLPQPATLGFSSGNADQATGMDKIQMPTGRKVNEL